MTQKLLFFIFILTLNYCGNNMQVEVPNSNQPIRDLVDNDQTNSGSNSYRQPSSVSSTNSSGAAGGTTSGAVGTPPSAPATGTATGNYSGNPTTSGY